MKIRIVRSEQHDILIYFILIIMLLIMSSCIPTAEFWNPPGSSVSLNSDRNNILVNKSIIAATNLHEKGASELNRALSLHKQGKNEEASKACFAASKYEDQVAKILKSIDDKSLSSGETSFVIKEIDKADKRSKECIIFGEYYQSLAEKTK